MDPVERAVAGLLASPPGEPAGPEQVWKVDLDKSTAIPGSPGIWDGLVITSWQ